MIQTETTPNPNALKFISENKFSEIGAKEFQKKDIKPNTNNLIKNLLEFDGVELVLVSDNFISVKKFENAKWDSLRPSIISEINDHLVKNKKPILLKNSEILEKSPTAILILKASLNADCDGQSGLQQLAGDATLLFYMTDEAKEGRDAFKAKRDTDFGKYPGFP